VQERRRHYRTPVGEFLSLSIAIVGQEGAAVSATLANLTSAGAGISFKASDSPAFDLGQVLDLEFSGSSLDNPVTVTSLVVHRSDLNSGRHYGLEFVEPKAFLDQLPREMRALFNMRRAHRVTTPRNNALHVSLRNGEFIQAVGVIHDVSTTGIGVLLGIEESRMLTECDAIEVSFQLPDQPDTFVFRGMIRHRLLTIDGVRLGIEFAAASDNFEFQQNSIAVYVSERQQQELWTVLQAL